MRIFVFFDLPVITSAGRREYRKFRSFLIKNGFIMHQESVYTKLVLNATAAGTVRNNVRLNKPLTGNVMILTVTEKQYEHMEILNSSYSSEYINNTERLVVL